MIHTADLNGDNLVDYEDFKKMMQDSAALHFHDSIKQQ